MNGEKKKTKKPGFLWGALFLLIFLLSLDFWRWGTEIRTTFLNFPSFLLHFIALQLLFAIAILLFIKMVWEKEDER